MNWDPIGRPKKLRTSKSVPLLRNLGLLFIGLKLAHQIDWSWWLVLAPNLVDFVGTQVMASWLRRQQERRGLR